VIRPPSGPTAFTRKAGLAGLLSVALSFAAFGTRSRDLEMTLLVAVVVGLLLLYAGLVVRHRRYRWSRAVVVLLALSVGFGVASADPVVARYGAAAAIMGLLLGVLVAGELLRGATAAVLLSAVFRNDDFRMGLLGYVLGTVGLVWLAWALWRERSPSPTPHAGSGRGSPEPA